jgi:enhancer of mRNA-decapping protein 3
VSSLQMLNLENIANSELGLTEDMMTENAARGIAEVALSALKGGSRLTQGTTNTLPYVVVYAGNNKSGQRAIAAGRHLRNHGTNVVVCVLGLEREPELLEGLRKQLKVFRSFGGKVLSKTELIEFVKTLDVPVELIVDGLLGLTISFEELRTGDQATAYELIEWANRSKASVLAIDIPTGLDASSGKVAIIDGSPLYLLANYVVAMGAPKKGLLEAMSADVPPESKSWQLFVADIGIANQVWKKAGTRVRRGVEFEGTWTVGIRFQKGVD